jgi:hypothetical protein
MTVGYHTHSFIPVTCSQGIMLLYFVWRWLNQPGMMQTGRQLANNVSIGKFTLQGWTSDA